MQIPTLYANDSFSFSQAILTTVYYKNIFSISLGLPDIPMLHLRVIKKVDAVSERTGSHIISLCTKRCKMLKTVQSNSQKYPKYQ